MNARTLSAALAVAALAGCTTHGKYSDLVVLKVIAGTFTPATPTTPAICTLSPSTNELDFMPQNPAANSGHVGLVVDNRLFNSASVNPILRTNTSDFEAHQAIINYEVVGGGAGLPVTQAAVPASGLIQQNSSGVIGVVVFPQGFGSLPVGTTIRTTIHIEGRLLDGSSARTNDREYLFVTCGGAGCGPTCT